MSSGCISYIAKGHKFSQEEVRVELTGDNISGQHTFVSRYVLHGRSKELAHGCLQITFSIKLGKMPAVNSSVQL